MSARKKGWLSSVRRIILIIVASIILAVDVLYVGAFIYSSVTSHIAIHNPSTPQDLYETLWDLRLTGALNAILFAILGVPAVGWLVMLVKSNTMVAKKSTKVAKEQKPKEDFPLWVYIAILGALILLPGIFFKIFSNDYKSQIREDIQQMIQESGD